MLVGIIGKFVAKLVTAIIAESTMADSDAQQK